jgi:hypothetical protein
VKEVQQRAERSARLLADDGDDRLVILRGFAMMLCRAEVVLR